MSTHAIMVALIMATGVSCLFVNSWATMWMLLEMNTLAFCSMSFMAFSWSEKETKISMMKYLIIQSIASSLLIFSVNWLNSQNVKILTLATVTPVIAIMLKAASAPIHQWFITLAKKMGWMNNAVLMTWQKLAPSFLLFYQAKKMITLFIVASVIMGSIPIINKTILKEIMALSSIFNLSWMMAAIFVSTKMFLCFSMLYWISVLFMIVIFMKTKMTSLKDFSWNTKKQITPVMMFLSIGGMPPLLGFLAKWMVITTISLKSFVIMVTFTTVMSAINMYIYMRTMNSNMLKNSVPAQKSKSPMYKSLLWLFLLVNSTSLTVILI